jgi:hypothetical protein
MHVASLGPGSEPDSAPFHIGSTSEQRLGQGLDAHFIIGQDGWEAVADSALSWATEHARASAAA